MFLKSCCYFFFVHCAVIVFFLLCVLLKFLLSELNFKRHCVDLKKGNRSLLEGLQIFIATKKKITKMNDTVMLWH
jgi:hypothetical protein